MKRPLLPALAAALACLATPLLRADIGVVPGAAHTAEGSGDSSLGSAGTVQLRYDAGYLRQAGLSSFDSITGISVRLDSTAPAFQEMDFTRFDIRLGEANPGTTMGTNLAANYSQVSQTVRTGPLLLTADAFSSGGSPNSFGAMIRFDTPYNYNTGGDLIVEIRSSMANTGCVIDAVTGTTGVDMVHSFDPDATTGDIEIPGYGWVIAFETTRSILTGTERIAIPSGAAAAEGNFDHGFGEAGGQRAQMRYLPAHLGSLKPGDRIEGIGFRLDETSPPFRSSTFDKFMVELGTASATFSNAPGTSFDSNLPSGTFFRLGPLTLHLEGFGTGPNPFSAISRSVVSSYVYTGGPLLVDVRSSASTTPLIIDSFTGGGYGGGLYAADPDASVGTTPAPDTNWAMELHVRRDRKKPEVEFHGSARLNAGGRVQAEFTVSDASTVGIVRIKAGSAKGRQVLLTKGSQRYKARVASSNRRNPRPVTLTVTAIDASGNRTVAKQTYVP